MCPLSSPLAQEKKEFKIAKTAAHLMEENLVVLSREKLHLGEEEKEEREG